MTAPMTPKELPATELKYLEDNIATVAWHLGRPGASIAVSYDNGVRLIVDAGAVLNEISRRLDPGNAQTVPSLTDAMIEAGARVAALRRGHKNCDELVTTANVGKQPVWKFYTEEPRAILEAVFNAAPPSNQGASK